MLDDFCRTDVDFYQEEFVARCEQEKFLVLFDPISLRETMNRWIQEDEKRGDFVMKKEAFSGRLSEAIIQMGARESYVSQQKLLKSRMGAPPNAS